MLAFPNLLTAPVRREEMRLALALLARHTSLEPRDAIHAAVAIRQGVRKIVSDDPDFDLIREQKRIPLA